MPAVKWIKELLDSRGLGYEEVHHARAVTAQGVAHQEHVSGRQVAKVVVVMAAGKPVQLVLPASMRVELGKLAKLLGAQDVRLAYETEMAELFADCALGAEPPLRHWGELEIWMDESMRIPGDIVFQAGTHEDGIRMRFADWFKLVGPKVGSFAV